ncbi:MAG: ROK family protein [Chloroflexi bacterium]|nr:ROK family protein [Chloroflexota bacterium]
MVISEQLVIGIDLGGTKISTALVNCSGGIVARDYRRTEAAEGQQAVVARMLDAARKVMAQSGVTRSQVAAVGIAAPGPLEIETGTTMSPPNLPGWKGVPLRQLVEDGLGITAFLEKDTNAAALGEFHFGAGRGTKHMIYVTASTGVGSGLILDGKLYYGADGMAGEIGHTTVAPDGPLCGCGNRGCLESLASGTAIAHRARERVARGVPTHIIDLVENDTDRITAELVARAAAQGDTEAREILAKAMNYLGIGVANLVNLFNPQLIVIGGGLTHIGEELFDLVRNAIVRHAFPRPAQTVRVVRAELGDQVGILGTAAVALTRVDQSLNTFLQS